MNPFVTDNKTRLSLLAIDANFMVRLLLAAGVIVSAFTVTHDVYNIRLGNQTLSELYKEEMRLMQVKSELLLERSNITTLGQVESQAIRTHKLQHLKPQQVEVWQ